MIKLREENKIQRKKSMPNGLILLLITLILLLFLINNYTNQTNCEQSSTIEINDNLFKCYDLSKNLTSFFQTFGKYKPTDQFKFHTDFEFKKKWIIDHYYTDFNEYKNKDTVINNSQIDTIQGLISNNLVYNPFEDIYLEKMIKKHLDYKSKIGILNWFEKDYYPWIEAVLLLNGANDITSLDFNNKLYENKFIKSMNLNDYLNNRLNLYSNNINLLFDEYQFNVVVSHLSIQTIGLGKYGEELQFEADLNVLNFINCILKQNGLLFLTLSTNNDFKNDLVSVIEFNAKRVYGKTRLDKLINNNNWFIVDRLSYKKGTEEIFVLQKM